MLLACIAITVQLAGPVSADAIADAEAAYERKEYAAALRIVRPLAEAGNADAQALYGRMYHNGLGTPQSHQEAANWYQKAATNGNADAQCGLAGLYLSEAPFASKRAEGAILARQGAEKGLAACQVELGYAYGLGRGRPRDWLIGHVWMNIAAANPNASRQTVSLAQELRRITERIVKGPQLADAQLLADEWHRGAVNQVSSADQRSKSPSARTFEVQRLLELLGFDAGVADGVPGPSTRTAISAFKKKFGRLDGDAIDEELIDALHREWAALGASGMAQTSARKPQGTATGTGFFVSRQGHVLTNNHVVTGCTSVVIRWPDGREKSVRVVGRSTDDDLALLAAEMEPSEVAVFRPNGQARLGETVTVYGFPLPSLLSSSGNLTMGAVTALAGLRDESRILQISAPVQSGNSGGPVIDSKGQVVGIVVSKIDVLAVAKKTDDLPQNVNFAIKGSVGTNFLDAKDVEYSFGDAAGPIATDDIVRKAKRFTIQVACNH